MTSHEEETNLTPESTPTPEPIKPVRARRTPAAKKPTPSPDLEITSENVTPEIETTDIPVEQTEDEIAPAITEEEDMTNVVDKKEKKDKKEKNKNKVKMKDKEKKKVAKANAKEKAKAKAKKAKKTKKDKAKKAKVKAKLKAKKAKAKSKKAKKNKKSKK
ncbi:hypothetical protein FVB9288_00817 [Flavobacterium sp. CECT 9288]|jgi:hypothetical protein|uniref:hypothetical protein n=1 Tax=unclassified Flavobacterium TaxID=196869 RepID=UPI000B699EA7|nr:MULTISPECIES: hypothetical protein [unclassified Flavobacterium]OUD35492.1 hypothetical protein FPG59_10125 [Flavobacterium sp. FPG59]CAH0335185.1 hypothetical protein FVB9288_00817 [Flavobacterium sp. CECT 9288]